MLGEINVRFIALLSPFDRTQGAVYWGKVSQVTVNINSIQQRGCCYGNKALFFVTADVPQCRVRSTCNSSRSSVPLTARKGLFIEEKSVKPPEISTRSSGVGAVGASS